MHFFFQKTEYFNAHYDISYFSNRLTLGHRDIVSGESYNRYFLKLRNSIHAIDYARCSALSSASARASRRAQFFPVLKTGHGERSWVHVGLRIRLLLLCCDFNLTNNPLTDFSKNRKHDMSQKSITLHAGEHTDRHSEASRRFSQLFWALKVKSANNVPSVSWILGEHTYTGTALSVHDLMYAVG
jgi:hypothetical protein